MLKMTEEEYASHQSKTLKTKEFYIPKKESKYRNKKITDADGIIHDSKREEKRWRELRLLFKSGSIVMLARQVEFLLPGGIIYRADFVYCQKIDELIVEDVKGVRTKEYRMKAKLLRERYGIEIVET